MNTDQTRDEADAAIEQHLRNLDDAESLFVAINAVATPTQAARVRENLEKIGKHRALMQRCDDVFSTARSFGL